MRSPEPPARRAAGSPALSWSIRTARSTYVRALTRNPPFGKAAELAHLGAEVVQADLGDAFQFRHDFNEDYCAVRDLEKTRALHPALQSFDAWLARHKERTARLMVM